MTALTRDQTSPFAIAWRTIAAGICAIGIWSSWCQSRADHLFRLDNEQSVQAAIRLQPDAWQYYMRLSLLDDAHAGELLKTALTLDPYNAQADIELALRYEAAGDLPRAEKLLLDAYAVDHTYMPRWSLANYYFRRGNLPAFWQWARSAAELPSDNAEPLFQLCWNVSPDANEITRRVLNDNPQLVRQYLTFLLTKDQLLSAAGIAERLSSIGDKSSDSAGMFAVIDRLVDANDGAAARSLWNVLIARKWVLADKTIPNNPDFARDPLPVSFDWALPSSSGLHSWPGPSGLETEFSGEEPENCTVAEQVLLLSPGNYEMDYSSRTENIPPATGLRWQIIDKASEKVLAESPDVSSLSAGDIKFPFSIPSDADASLVRVRLRYLRTIGTARISGTLVIPSVHIFAKP